MKRKKNVPLQVKIVGRLRWFYLRIFAFTSFPTGKRSFQFFTKYFERFFICTRPTIPGDKLKRKIKTDNSQMSVYKKTLPLKSVKKE